jgi:signal peptidase I
MSESRAWSTPYAQSGGSYSLSGPALAEVAREVLARGHSFRFLAPGGSMSPFIRDGDVVTLVPLDGSTCISGDVVAFVMPRSGRLVVHRTIAVDGDRYRIQGDNNPEEDGEFPRNVIIGRVARIERNGCVIRFGLGPERALIALLSRRRWLPRCTRAVAAVCSGLRRFS